MVLRHYSVRTRLLDWSLSPYVAAFFAVHDHDTSDAEIWSFDHDHYAQVGKEQWQRWPETTADGSVDPSKFRAELTAFIADEPPDWIIAAFYPFGFPRRTLSAEPTQSLLDFAAIMHMRCKMC